MQASVCIRILGVLKLQILPSKHFISSNHDILLCRKIKVRSQWPRGLRRVYTSAPLLELQVSMQPGALVECHL